MTTHRIQAQRVSHVDTRTVAAAGALITLILHWAFINRPY
jgi:hypothetical protein